MPTIVGVPGRFLSTSSQKADSGLPDYFALVATRDLCRNEKEIIVKHKMLRFLGGLTVVAVLSLTTVAHSEAAMRAACFPQFSSYVMYQENSVYVCQEVYVCVAKTSTCLWVMDL